MSYQVTERRKCMSLREKEQAPYPVITIIRHSGNGETMDTVKRSVVEG